MPPLPGCKESVILGKIKINGINIANANILYTEDILAFFTSSEIELLNKKYEMENYINHIAELDKNRIISEHKTIITILKTL